MKKIESAEELHNILLGIAICFHTLCEKHHIPYYMLGGTMLGAVRHKGFIPWDDDMDFGVPREYFSQLKEILNKELPSQYRCLNVDNSPYVLTGLIKIEDSNTAIKELYKENIDSSIGVNIDIFPLDISNNKTKPFSKNWLIHALISIQYYRFLSIKQRPGLKKIIAIFIKFFFFFLTPSSIITFIEKHLINNVGENLANHYGAWGMKEIVNKDYFGSPSLYPFEDIQLSGVSNPDSYLKCLYKNYMELPPVNKRHLHITEMYYVE